MGEERDIKTMDVCVCVCFCAKQKRTLYAANFLGSFRPFQYIIYKIDMVTFCAKILMGLVQHDPIRRVVVVVVVVIGYGV